jgi:leader peptidase (prepilin peptidase)/N-methyltransferase
LALLLYLTACGRNFQYQRRNTLVFLFMEWVMIIFTILLFGLTIGSFLNVVIYRLPLGQSITFPPSHCPQCEQRLRWYELIPVISYMLQGGKCRSCRIAIPIRYPLVELLTGILYIMLYLHFGLSYKFFTAILFISVLIPIIFIDLQHQLIPDSLNVAGVILGISVLPWSDVSLTSAALGFLVGGGIMLLIAVISHGGMGGGDIKMMAMMGIFLGLKLTCLALFLSFIFGGVVSLIVILLGIKKRKDFIPFGPFLALGGFTSCGFGNEIIAWYIRIAFS